MCFVVGLGYSRDILQAVLSAQLCDGLPSKGLDVWLSSHLY